MYTLIIVALTINGASIDHVEFQSQQACEVAHDVLWQAMSQGDSRHSPFAQRWSHRILRSEGEEQVKHLFVFLSVLTGVQVMFVDKVEQAIGGGALCVAMAIIALAEKK